MTYDANDEIVPNHEQHDDSVDPGGPDVRSTDSLLTKMGLLCETVTQLSGVDGAAVAGPMSTGSRELVYATDAVAERIDELQFTVGEGPCLDAYGAQLPQLFPRIGAAGPQHRWSAFSAGLQDLGVEAVFAFPVPGPQQSLGVLELYRRTPGGLTDAQLDYATVCAQAMGQTILSTLPRALAASQATLHVEAALQSSGGPFNRSGVFVAAEMVALQLNVSSDEALARLRAHAYAGDTSVASVAAAIMAGALTLHT